MTTKDIKIGDKVQELRYNIYGEILEFYKNDPTKVLVGFTDFSGTKFSQKIDLSDLKLL